MRRESKEQIEQLEKDKRITEDDKSNGLEMLQKIIALQQLIYQKENPDRDREG